MGKHELLQEWIDRGHNDFRSADYLSTMHHPTPDEIICYLCQQSAEKYLKAFLFLYNLIFCREFKGIRALPANTLASFAPLRAFARKIRRCRNAHGLRGVAWALLRGTSLA